MPVRIFIHGLESGNQGTKSVFFRQKYPDMRIPNFTGNLPERMDKLNAVLAGARDIRLIGSSFGGLMATLYALENPWRVTRLVLLAPALNMMPPGAVGEKQISIPTHVFHGRQDDVIPLCEIEPIARRIFASLQFNTVEDDHMLHRTFKTLDWDAFLE